jgi:hypothetical protein
VRVVMELCGRHTAPGGDDEKNRSEAFAGDHVRLSARWEALQMDGVKDSDRIITRPALVDPDGPTAALYASRDECASPPASHRRRDLPFRGDRARIPRRRSDLVSAGARNR